MARPRKSSEEQNLKGAFDKDPSRARVDPVAKALIGDPPKRLSKLEKSIWDELKANSLPGILKDSDRDAFETLCRLKAIERKYGIGGPGSPLGLNNGQLTGMTNLFGRFGMTPADRTRLAAPAKKKTKAEDDFTEFDEPQKNTGARLN
jgi:phage terminase small subunit